MLFKILQYLYLLSCVSADLTVRLSKMQNDIQKSVQLVYVTITLGAILLVLWFLIYFTCSGLIILLLFTIGCAGHKYRGVETITNAIWFTEGHLLIFAPLFSVLPIMYLLGICKQTNVVYDCSNWLYRLPLFILKCTFKQRLVLCVGIYVMICTTDRISCR